MHKDIDFFKTLAYMLQRMAGVDKIHIVPKANRPKNAASINIHGLQIYIHDITNDKEEHKRTTKAIAQLEQKIANKQTKLNNPKFITRAKAEIVTEVRNDLNGLLIEQRSLLLRLKELDGNDKI